MGLIDDILGRRSVRENTSDVVPVVAGKQRLPLRKEPPKDKEDDKLKDRARRSSVVAHIMGMTESDDEAIIPDTAQSLDPMQTHQIPGLSSRNPVDDNEEEPSEPSRTNIHGEELIPPSAALVAPDVTPNVMVPLDPSQVPAGARTMERPAPPSPMGQPEAGAPAQPPMGTSPNRGVLDTILGRQNTGPQPAAAAQAMAESMLHQDAAAQAMAEAMMNEAVNGTIQERVASKIVPAAEGGEGMPIHREGDGRSVYNAFRRFTG
jgi:hypothetical protein